MIEKSAPKKKVRQAKILTELQILPQMKVKDLSERLQVSQETIRRDLAELDSQGKISRTFGGAVGLSSVVPGISERQTLMINERDQISTIAANLIEPNDLLMVGGGSTTMRFALKFSTITFPLTIVTHSLPFAVMVSKNKFISVEMLPGKLNPDEGLTYGSNTVDSIRQLSAHKAFIGASGVNESGLQALREPGEVYGAMLNSAKEAYVLADSSKFGATSLAQYSTWKDKITFISDKLPNQSIQDALRAASVKILLP